MTNPLTPLFLFDEKYLKEVILIGKEPYNELHISLEG